MVHIRFDYITAGLLLAFYLVGFILALNSVFQGRTPQGKMAWLMALIFIPFISIPLFLIFGKRRLDFYDDLDKELISLRKKVEIGLAPFKVVDHQSAVDIFPEHGEIQILDGNEMKLLIDGEETFGAMLNAIEAAEHYIFLQTYIFRTDSIGKIFADALSKKARLGVKVYCHYEKIWIHMSQDVLDEMSDAGVKLGEFAHKHLNALSFNFRNHRKLLIIDGRTGFFGGMNIGDDYLGRYPEIGHWRDTNVEIRGPAMAMAQIEFIKDWYWSQNKMIDIPMRTPVGEGDAKILVLNSDPSDEYHHNLLQHIGMINSSKKRLWIANPYLVPPQGIIDALFIAINRGVDVRILVPEKSDNPFVQFAMQTYLERFLKVGIRIFKYQRGMMHQKVILVDDFLGLVGSANLDYRSMYLNFENAIATNDAAFLFALDLALRKDFDNSLEMQFSSFESVGFFRKLLYRSADCISPVL